MSIATAEYQYRALSTVDSIRLLTFSRDECQPHGMLLSLAEARLSDQPEFIALSYTWHLPEYADTRDRSDPGEGKTFEVVCDGRLMRISENLFSFLDNALSIRDAGAENTASAANTTSRLFSKTAGLLERFPMWIDAFCINQSNNDEKKRQVLLMHRIYSSAKNVVVWMGPAEPDANTLWIHDRFIPQLAKLTREKPDFVARHLEKDPLCMSDEVILELGAETCSRWTTAWISLMNFFKRRRWFYRGWVVQEVSMADPACVLVLCGTTTMIWKRLAAFSHFLHLSKWSISLVPHFAQAVQPRPEWLRRGHKLDSVFDHSTPNKHLTNVEAGVPTMPREFEAIGGALGVGEELRQISQIRPVLAGTVSRTSILDGAGKWQSDSETAWFMCAGLIVRSLRSSHFRDDRDHLYGCLGMLSTLLPQDVASPIVPNYEMSVEELYTLFSVLVLQKTPLSFHLSQVECQTGRTYKELPSWVPDYSTPPVQDPSWNKYLGITTDIATQLESPNDSQGGAWSGDVRSPQNVGSSLFLYGTQLGIVANTGCASERQWKGVVLPAVLNMILDTKRGLFNQPQSSFWDAVAAVLLYESLKNCAQGGDLTDIRLTRVWSEINIGNLMQARRLCLASDTEIREDRYWHLPGPDGRSLTSQLSRFSKLRKASDQAKMCLESVSAACISHHVWADLKRRCLYTTCDNRLGLGPAAMTLGDDEKVVWNGTSWRQLPPPDEVWLLEGARTPFILRRRVAEAPEVNGGDVDDCVTFKMIGETHLHGFDVQSSNLASHEKRHLFQKIRIV
ncbi:heterokaryon incompatibility protein 6, OR allele [Colletotrichum liriopes]|uniref:Heterokaryon incompatibility protein 6, OR allele n=1 Tax=Colletotrichum liriopes TaxID=708192 RepID=A0AA37GMC4_9PEZI|nr:heterokaryon incompatibility protein 6, OR allele [Colletotrichum liriopes]